MTTKPNQPKHCLSTHGADGYALGTYVKDDRIICGVCQEDITNAVQTSEPVYVDYGWLENPWKRFNGERKFTGKYREITMKEKLGRLPKWINRT